MAWEPPIRLRLGASHCYFPAWRCLPATFRRVAPCASTPWWPYATNDLWQDGQRGLAALAVGRTQIGVEKVRHAMPGVTQNVFAAKVMKFARVHHESDEIAFTFLQGFVDEPDRF